MLANHVEAEVFRLLYVVNQSLVRGGGIEAVGPPALVQRAELEQVAVVQLPSHHTACVALGRELSHGCIAVHRIRFRAVLFQTYFECI